MGRAPAPHGGDPVTRHRPTAMHSRGAKSRDSPKSFHVTTATLPMTPPSTGLVTSMYLPVEGATYAAPVQLSTVTGAEPDAKEDIVVD